MSQSLDHLLKSAAAGDTASWRTLIEAYSGRVYALLFRRCGDGDLAEELTQATFVKVVAKLGNYRESGKFEAWLFRIAINCLRDEMRRRKRQAGTLDFNATSPEALGYVDEKAAPSPLRAMEQSEQFDLLRRTVAELPEADREIIELRYIAELTFVQIADTLDQPLGTVLARCHRTMKKLRDMMRQKAEKAD